MKKFLVMRLTTLIILGIIMLTVVPSTEAQDKQYKARISAEYHKIMGLERFIEVNVKFKGEDGYEPATNLSLNVYQEVVEDSLLLAGTVTTNEYGIARFIITADKIVVADSIVTQYYVVKIEDSDRFKDGSKSVKFIDVNIAAEAIVEDSVDHIRAILTDGLGNPIEDQKLSVSVQRLFAPLTIGKSSYRTDDDGIILVPMEVPLPGIDGILTFEVMLDGRKYGIVKHVFDAPIGVPVVDQSTFDDRTMWSPPNKTPLFLWIFPNIIIFGIWAIIMLLITNLYKISKS